MEGRQGSDGRVRARRPRNIVEVLIPKELGRDGDIIEPDLAQEAVFLNKRKSNWVKSRLFPPYELYGSCF